MKRFFSCSWTVLTWMLALTFAPGWILPASAQAVPPVLPLTSEPPRPDLPKVAGSHRDKAYRQMWEGLDPEKRKEVFEAFRKIVGPELQKAYEKNRTAPAGDAGFGPSPFIRRPANDDPPYGDPPWGYPPEVSASAHPASGSAPLTVDLSAYAYDPDGWIVSSYWDFGDGGYSYDLYSSHTYYSPGSYLATVYVSDDQGYSASSSVWIDVTGGGGNQPPQVSASASPLAGTAPLNVTLNAGGSDPDGFIASWTWSFGDGAGASGPTVFHTYGSPGNYVASVTVTDDQGASATAWIAIQVQPPLSGADSDGDGLPDELETQLADNFTPAYSLSYFEYSGTGLSLFQDRSDMPVASQVFPASPPTLTSYYRVTPLGVVGGQSYLQVDYLSLWNRDDGLAINGACASDIDILDFFGIFSPGFGTGLRGHDFDHERSMVRLVAPAAGGGFNMDPSAYRLDRFFTAAHEGTDFDHSDFYTINPPAGPEAHYGLYMSLSKHGTYGYWPHGLPLMPYWMIGSIYGGVETACYFWYDWCGLFYYIADEVVFDCVTEKHLPQDWALARGDLRINVGEMEHPLPGGSIINNSQFGNQLYKRFTFP